ncbi:hypothetical protein BDF21DRAFT_452898 [Thamnidium elegans]|nr:hypothetical protein BDF21DRAFT_452898 [Thamnidium elegans]
MTDPSEDNQEPARKNSKKRESRKDTSHVEQATEFNQDSETEDDTLVKFRHMVIEDSNKKWKQLSPGDGPEESNKPVVLAFGAAMFGNLRGNVPASTKVVKDCLIKFARERNKKGPTYVVMVDEYLTSQICPRCQTRTTSNEKKQLQLKNTPCTQMLYL